MRKWIEYVVVLLALLCCGVARPAQLLVYDKDHWLDSLSKEDLAKRIESDSDLTQADVDARYRRGDIIDVFPDGTLLAKNGKHWGDHAFRVVEVPDLPYGTARGYLVRSTTQGARRRFKITSDADKKFIECTDLRSVTMVDKNDDETIDLHAVVYGPDRTPDSALTMVALASSFLLGGGLVLHRRHRRG